MRKATESHAGIMTIGMDLGNRKHSVCGLDAGGNKVLECEVENTREALGAFFSEHAGSRVGMETGTHCRWVSALAAERGCDAKVADARSLGIVYGSRRKNDRVDAEKLARVLKFDPTLFHPVKLRDDRRHHLLQLLKLRDGMVACRTLMVNKVRGLCKARGVILRKCDAASFASWARAELPEGLAGVFGPLLDALESVGGAIAAYDAQVGEAVEAGYGEDAGLLRGIPGVGPVTAAAFIAVAGDVSRYRRARDAGAYLGLAPGQDQSGDSDAPRPITKEGDALVRRLLVNAANHILRKNSADSPLKRFGERLCGKGGKIARRKAKVALARKLAVVMAALPMTRRPYGNPFAGKDGAKGTEGAA